MLLILRESAFATPPKIIIAAGVAVKPILKMNLGKKGLYMARVARIVRVLPSSTRRTHLSPVCWDNRPHCDMGLLRKIGQSGGLQPAAVEEVSEPLKGSIKFSAIPIQLSIT
jgi:hypothetical protein